MEDTTIEDVLKTFEDLYIKKDYDNALLTLQKHGDQFDPGPLNYNFGTVYAQMKNWPLARYHFLKAEIIGLSHPALDQNLKAVEEKLDLQRLERPFSTTDYIVKAGLAASDGVLTSVSLIIVLIGLVTLKKSINIMKIIFWLFLAVIPLGLDWWIDSWPKSVALSNLAISEGPSAIFGNVGELPAGVMVITKEKGEWLKVVYPSRFSGWIKIQGLMALE